jgi:hypothetical protein
MPAELRETVELLAPEDELGAPAADKMLARRDCSVPAVAPARLGSE